MIDDVLPGRKVAVSHFGVSCLDFPKVLDFYTRVIGLTESDAGTIESGGGTELAFLTTDPREHHQFVLAANRRDQVVETSSVGGSVGSNVFQVSFRVRDLDALRSISARLTDYGITDQNAISHGNAWSLYCRDPEGNALEFFVDSPWYVAQPCAEPLDLARSDEEILEETRAYCMAQPEVMPYGEWVTRIGQKILTDQSML